MTATQRWTMVAAILGSSIVFLDGTVVNLALKAIGADLPATIVGTLEGQTYVTSGYLATLAALLILAGALGDYFGRRRIFALGLTGFGVTSVMCGLAPTLELLALFRILQGAAGALLVPGSLAVITATFQGPERGRAFGIWASATSAANLIGPILGGVLVDAASWRSAFLINVPLVAIALYATVRHMPDSRDETASGRFDWLGAAVVAVAVGGLAFGAVRGEQRQWSDPIAYVALSLGAVAALAFVPLMARRPDPLVPLSMFRSRQFSTINLSTLLIYSALYVNLQFQALFLVGTIGYSATAAGVVGVPTSILLVLLSTRIGAIAGRVGPRPFLVAGPLVMAAGMAWWARIPASSEPWTLYGSSNIVPPVSVLVDVLPAILLFGFGLSLVVAPLTTALMTSVPVHNAGRASAINNAVSRVGQPILAAVIFVVVTTNFYATLDQRLSGVDTSSPAFRSEVSPLNAPREAVPEEVRVAARDASTDAFHLAVLVQAVLLVAGAAVNYVGLGNRSRTGTDRVLPDEPPGPTAREG